LFSYDHSDLPSSSKPAGTATTTTTRMGMSSARSSSDDNDNDEIEALRLTSSSNLLSKLKPEATKAKSKSALAETTTRKVGYMVKSCLLYGAYILYKAFHGIVVVLPEAFRRVYDGFKRADVVVYDPFRDDENDGDVKSSSSTTLKTKTIIAVLATVVTTSYVVDGAVRVVSKFFRTLIRTRGRDVAAAFAAAASEQDRIENLVSRNVLGKNVPIIDDYYDDVVDGSSGSNDRNDVNGGKFGDDDEEEDAVDVDDEGEDDVDDGGEDEPPPSDLAP